MDATVNEWPLCSHLHVHTWSTLHQRHQVPVCHWNDSGHAGLTGMYIYTYAAYLCTTAAVCSVYIVQWQGPFWCVRCAATWLPPTKSSKNHLAIGYTILYHKVCMCMHMCALKLHEDVARLFCIWIYIYICISLVWCWRLAYIHTYTGVPNKDIYNII